ncbi:MAG: sn-glycerol-1-phosphate dehydrogenase [Clostridia bacterium]|nr:sn-glycerol-1-phosphate dehydrogenase [Clostridia bacterium]
MQTSYDIQELIKRPPFLCACGREHRAHLKDAVVRPGAIDALSGYAKKYGGTKAYLIADENTFAAAGGKAARNLEENGIPYTRFTYGKERVEPDEKAIGSAILHFDHGCDILVAVGSGVINDITKILAKMTGLPFIVVATAPSMDGYASSTSSVIRNGLKVSVDSACPDVIIGDTDVLKEAPTLMLQAGLGDMLAKYTSLCEWRIGREVTGEYYCEEVAKMIRAAVKKCVDNAPGILTRSEAAVNAVMEGLIISGIAADWAGVSRPVSGTEHYFSHLWDMRALEFGTPWSLHGVQCGIGELLTIGRYETLKTMRPDKEEAHRFFDGFDREAWFGKIREYLGKSADAIIDGAKSSDRYDRAKHARRVCNICGRWDRILKIIGEELPSYEEMKRILEIIGAPTKPSDIGIPDEETDLAFRMTRDIRDKYILSSLMWDMGKF